MVIVKKLEQVKLKLQLELQNPKLSSIKKEYIQEKIKMIREVWYKKNN